MFRLLKKYSLSLILVLLGFIGANAQSDEEHSSSKYFSDTSAFRFTDDGLTMRQLPDSVVEAMRKDDDFWYANADFKKKEKGKEKEREYEYKEPLGERTWFKTLMWMIIIGGFASFLVWYLMGNNVSLFRKGNRSIDGTSGDGELNTDDIFAINYQKEIDKAAAEGNYRLAIRLMFLRLLKGLSEKNIIQYKLDRTNFDYLMQMHPTRYYNDFFRVTRNYEYSWYGQFTISDEAYNVIKKDFDNLTNQIK